MDSDCQCAIEDFNATILGRAVGARRFHSISKIVQHDPAEFRTSCKFTALVRADAAIASSKLFEESAKYVKWVFFYFVKKHQTRREAPSPMTRYAQNPS